MNDRDYAIEAQSLTKIYDSRSVLDNVSFQVPRGSMFGLVGPNGSGKTTLLSILAGLRKPSAGSYFVNAHNVAVLPDTPNFEPWLTAFELVDLARTLVRPDLPVSSVSEVLAETGLGMAINRRIGGFSRGMLQRLGVAATLVGQPEILLLDEPCSALDPIGRRDILDLIAGQGGRRTIIFSSHILADVQAVCDSVGILSEGRLLYQGTIDALLRDRLSPTFLVEVREDTSTASAALRRQEWVKEVREPAKHQIAVTVESIEAAEKPLIHLLAAVDARVRSLRLQEVSLEEVFMELTR